MLDSAPADSVRFLRTCFQPDDWIAVFLKNYHDGRVVQRVGPMSWAMSDHVLAWLSAMNERRFNVYCSVNALEPGRRSRTRESVAGIRHVFLDADNDSPAVLARIAECGELPTPSYVLTSSPGRMHIFWRATGFDRGGVEALQKHLARNLGTDGAATPVSQTTRIVGFKNHKHERPCVVTVAYGDVDRAFTPEDFPSVPEPATALDIPMLLSPWPGSRVERALRYVARVPPAIAGQHGDVRTFQVCCRLVRGFALDDDDALTVLQSWNARCIPPWTDSELRDKVRRARKYGREPIGGLLTP